MKIVNGEKRGRPGRWLLDFYDQDGKRHWETFDTQKEAKSALADRLDQVKRGAYRAPDKVPTLKERAEAWLANKADRRPWRNGRTTFTTTSLRRRSVPCGPTT
jgi:hypothetical protein